MTPYYPKGGLDLLITSSQKNGLSQKGISEIKAFQYFGDILAGLKYLHKNSLRHGNLKPSNVLLDEFNRVKLTDYGWSALSQKIVSIAITENQIEFFAPEILQFEPYTASADIYSLGMLLYYMVVGETPFPKNIKLSRFGLTILRAGWSYTQRIK